jgi:hypothetical protein
MTAIIHPISIRRMVCTRCGAEANASCNCGVTYQPKAVRAAEAIKANPGKSDRAIAAEVGVGHATVSRARKEATVSDETVQERTGLDGKKRKVPERKGAADLTAERAAFWKENGPKVWAKSHPDHHGDEWEIWGSCSATEEEEREWSRWHHDDWLPYEAAHGPDAAPEPKTPEPEVDEYEWPVKPKDKAKKQSFLQNAKMAKKLGGYEGPIDDEMQKAAGHTADVWASYAGKNTKWKTQSSVYVDMANRQYKLEKRNAALAAALNAKEAQASRNWPTEMTAKQIKQREKLLQYIAWNQRDLEQLYGKVTGQPSWRVEVTTKDGTRLGTGARFGTRGEAEFYKTHFATVDLKDCYATGEVIACKDEANVLIEGEVLRFSHGDCVLLKWQPVDGAAPEDDDLSTPEKIVP